MKLHLWTACLPLQISPKPNDLCMIVVECMHGILELCLQLPNKNLLSSTDAFKTTTL